jgi:hypothetical protein
MCVFLLLVKDINVKFNEHVLMRARHSGSKEGAKTATPHNIFSPPDSSSQLQLFTPSDIA